MPPPIKEIPVERHSRALPPTTLAPAESHIAHHAPTALPTIRVSPTEGNGAVLALFLEVVSMQLTPQLQMGAIRSRPASLSASLRLQSAATRNAIPAELGFQLGPAKLNVEGRISTLRLVPTSKPFQPAQMRTAFEIGGVALIPDEPRPPVHRPP